MTGNEVAQQKISWLYSEIQRSKTLGFQSVVHQRLGQGETGVRIQLLPRRSRIPTAL